MRRSIFILLLCCLSLIARGAPPQAPLPMDEAFQFSAMMKDKQTALLTWQMKSSYYLYRNRIRVIPAHPTRVQIGQPLLPIGKLKDIPTLGRIEILEKQITVGIPVLKDDSGQISLKVFYQGCSSKGYCYPPTMKVVTLNTSGPFMTPVSGVKMDLPQTSQTRQNNLKSDNLLSSQKSVWLILVGFFGLGLMLSLTPCVLPMIPILSGIIVGHKKLTHWHAFFISLAYVFGVAIIYALVGLLFGYLGSTLQTIMQKPWIIISFSLLFVALALALFGVYTLQLPERIRNRFATLSAHQKHGSYIGAFLMGCLSTLILSPCVTPPLVAALGYISQTGHTALGGLVLFIMALGMGVPLLIIGATSAKFLPKAGHWMQTIERTVGFLILGVAIYMLSRVIPDVVTLLLWAGLLMGYAFYLGAFRSAHSTSARIGKVIGVLSFVYGIFLIIGAIEGNDNPLDPLNLSGVPHTTRSTPFIRVKTPQDVQAYLSQSSKSGKPVLLDFYADWCISCKIMERNVFEDSRVKAKLKSFVLLQADVTQNNLQDKILMRYFHVIAPPTLIFFNQRGKTIPSARLVGEISAAQFLKHLEKNYSDQQGT